MSGRGLSVMSALFLAAVLSSCSFIWLGGIEVNTVPSEPEKILGADDSIEISFSEIPDHYSFESIFSLAGPDGEETGKFLWEGCYAAFKPDKAMQPGFRYRIQIKGSLKTADGKTFSQYIDIPFYYLTNDLPPVLVSAVPENASLVGLDQAVILTFSKPIDSDTFDDGFTLSPSAEFGYSWNDDYTVVTITPDETWVNLNRYSWTIYTKVTDQSGIPIPRNCSGSFYVRTDTEPPSITGVYPVSDNSDGSYTVLTVFSAEDLLFSQHLAVVFSECIDFSSLERKLTFTPSINGFIMPLDCSTAMYYIDEDLPPAAEYTLKIEEGLADVSGNLTIDDWEIKFTPSIPAQKILNIEIEDNTAPDLIIEADGCNRDGYITIPDLDYYDTDKLYFYISLAEGFPSEYLNNRREFLSGINLSAAFPPGTAAPVLYSSDWETETRIRMIYEGLVSCTAEQPVYYKFRIAAGSPDSATPGGSYLIDPVSFVFRAGEL